MASFQRTVAAAVMRPLARGESISRDSARVAADFVKPNKRLSAAERLQIYNQQYWWRLLGNMREDFPGLLAVLGQRKFEKLAVAYLEACGSRSWSLRDVGQDLEAFLDNRPELAAPRTALARDMVRLEWARVVAFDGPSKAGLRAARLRHDPANLRIRLQPNLTLLELTHPVDRLLAGLKKRDSAVASNAVVGATRRRGVRLDARPSRAPIHLSVYRHELSVYFKRLDAPAFNLLRALRDGRTLGEACVEAFPEDPASNDKAAEKITVWFSEWTALGWLIAETRAR